MHSPIKDLALSGFTEVEPRARTVAPVAAEPSFFARVWGRLAAWRHHLKSQDELARFTDRDWEVGDFGINRWQAETILRTPFWKQ